MTPISALALAAWSLVAGRLLMLASHSRRARAARDPHAPRADGWHPRVTSGCGR